MDSYQSHLLTEIKSLYSKKPTDSAPPTIQDAFYLRIQAIYFEIISKFPALAIDQKLELEMWTNLYKTPMDALQNIVSF